MRIYFILNVGGRRGPPQRIVEGMRALLDGSGMDYRVVASDSIEHSGGLVDEAVLSGFDTLWIGGGDGTVNVLLNYAFGKDMTFGVVPLGTVNTLARSLGLLLDPLAAVSQLLRATPMPMDVGRINDRHFLCFASVGFDAGVAHDVNVRGANKRLFGRIAFAAAGLAAAFKLGRIREFELTELVTRESESVQNTVRRGHSLMLSNIRNYAGFNLFHEASPNSGTMDMTLFRRNALLPMIEWGARAMARAPQSLRQDVERHKSAGFVIRSADPLFLQMDGEPVHLGDDREFRFTCLPGATKVLIPSA
jgi:diacylglycerol kinase family enzyme